MDIVGAGFSDDARNRAVREHASLMQHYEIVAGLDLVEQMRRPEHADALLRHQLANVVENIGAGLYVEPDGRLVEQQQARPMQERACDFQPPHLAAREVAHLAAGALSKTQARQHLVATNARFAPRDAVQGSVIKQVLHDGEIEVERTGLEHHAQQTQRLAGRNADGDPWSVGIRHPRDAHALFDTLRVSDAAVCTSGDYERRASSANGDHHILDPRTGRSPGSLASVTVIADRAMVADALATAAFVLGPVDGLQLLERHGLDALLVTPELERLATRGMSTRARADEGSPAAAHDR